MYHITFVKGWINFQRRYNLSQGRGGLSTSGNSFPENPAMVGITHMCWRRSKSLEDSVVESIEL